MQVSKETLEKSQIKLTIELSADELLPYIEKAGRRMAEAMNIPGFRKGQAPLELVKKKAGEMPLLQNASELAVQSVLPKAIKDEGLETVGQPEIGIEKLAPDNPFVFTATLPLLPKITLGDVSQVNVKKETVDVTEDDVDKVIENMRMMRAKEVLVDRQAKKGDKVEITFNVYLDKIPIDGGSSDKFPLIIGDNSMIPGFEDKVVGMKKDEEKEFQLPFPADYNNKQLAGKTCDFKVKVLSVFEMTPPALDKDFAAELGGFESVDALKDAIEKNINQEKQMKLEGDFERTVLEQYIELSSFGDIPESMVNSESQMMMRELEQNITQKGLKFDEYLLHVKKDRGQLLLDFTPDAVKRIKSALVIKALAKEQNVTPNEEEIAKEMDSLRHMYQGNKEVLAQLETASYKEYITNVVRNKKTIHWLKDTVEKSAA